MATTVPDPPQAAARGRAGASPSGVRRPAAFPSRAPHAGGCRPARRGQAPHAGAAPRGGGAARRGVHDLLHLPGAGPRCAAVATGAGRAGGGTAAVRDRARAPVPARPGRAARRRRGRAGRDAGAGARRDGGTSRPLPGLREGQAVGRARGEPGRPGPVHRLDGPAAGGPEPALVDVHRSGGAKGLRRLGARGSGHARPVPGRRGPQVRRSRLHRADRAATGRAPRSAPGGPGTTCCRWPSA